MELKDWVRDARAHAKINQDQLAEYLSLAGKGTISAWETGRSSPDFMQVLSVAKVTKHPLPILLDLSPSQLPTVLRIGLQIAAAIPGKSLR